jgi:hypothetical protein
MGERVPHLSGAEQSTARPRSAAVPAGVAADWIAAALPTIHLLLTGLPAPVREATPDPGAAPEQDSASDDLDSLEPAR